MKVHAQVDCGPGIVEIGKTYLAYSIFMRATIHEIGHLWVWHNVGNKRETHGKNFRRYCDIIEKSFNGLQVFEIPWINTIKETKDDE